MLRPGDVIAICVVGLLTLAVVMVNSASMTIDAAVPVSAKSLLMSKSSIYMGLAIVAMIVAAWFPFWRLLPGVRGGPAPQAPRTGWAVRTLWIGAFLLLAACALVFIPGLKRAVNGSHRWIALPIGHSDLLSVQPSEIAKWGLVLLMAWYGWLMGSSADASGKPRIASFIHGLIPALVAAGAVAGFVAIEDLGTGVLLGLVACVVLLAAGARAWQFALLLPVGAGAVVGFILHNPYRMARITSFLHPYNDPEGNGYHGIQSMAAISNGHITGRGLGHGLQKFGYLPEGTTDFLFSNICEELGLPGAALVICLYVGIVWAGYLIIRRQTSMMLKLIAVGIVSTIAIQAVVNLMVVTGMAPTKGIALPLLSSGGTGWILTAASLGLLISIDRLGRRMAAGFVSMDMPASAAPSASASPAIASSDAELDLSAASPTPSPA